MKKLIPGVFLWLLSLPLTAESKPDPALAQDPAWLKLLHYHRDILGRHRSSIDDPVFFLAPNGHKDPAAELKATVDAFTYHVLIDSQPAACAYPARYDTLKEHGYDFGPDPVCERFESWKEKLAPESVSLVFASYYLNNPASMYGHTFLKLGRKGYEDKGPLLDYTINYAAETNTNNGVMFAVKGLMGGYNGRFSTEPYYVKIQKYTNMESRDLWEYKLNFDQKAIDRLVKHLWELGPTKISYFFFNKNCSYQLLPLLEAADPRFDLSKNHKFRAIPLDTLQSIVDQPGLLDSYKLRPSHLRVMMTRRSELNAAERDVVKGLLDKNPEWALSSLSRLPKARQALILDTAYDLLKVRTGFVRFKPEAVKDKNVEAVIEKERQLLLLRKDVAVDSQDSVTPVFKAVPPHEGHRTGRVGLSYGVDNNDQFQEFNIRSALHDLESDPHGYIEGSQLEMFNVRLRHHDNTGRVTLKEFTFFNIFSLSPWDPWRHSPSWSVKTGADVAHEFEKKPDHSLYYGLRGGSGVAFKGPLKSLFYVMWTGEGDVGSVFRDGYRLGAGGCTGVLMPQGSKARLHVSAAALRFGIGHPDNVVRFHVMETVNITRNFEARLGYEREDGYHEGTAGFNYYW